MKAEIQGEEPGGSFRLRLFRDAIADCHTSPERTPSFTFRIDESLEVAGRMKRSTARDFIRRVRWLSECVVFLYAHPITLMTIWHEGRLHRVGEDHPDRTLVKVRYIDIF